MNNLRTRIQNAHGRHCAFCRRAGGAPFVITVLEHFGGEPGNGYAHANCFVKAKRRSTQPKEK